MLLDKQRQPGQEPYFATSFRMMASAPDLYLSPKTWYLRLLPNMAK
jgi:hypothetical protein